MMASQVSHDCQVVWVPYIFDFLFWKAKQEDRTNCKVHELVALYTKSVQSLEALRVPRITGSTPHKLNDEKTLITTNKLEPHIKNVYLGTWCSELTGRISLFHCTELFQNSYSCKKKTGFPISSGANFLKKFDKFLYHNNYPCPPPLFL